MSEVLSDKVKRLETRADKVDDAITGVNQTLTAFQLSIIEKMSESNSKIEGHISKIVNVTERHDARLNDHDQRFQHVESDISTFRSELGRIAWKLAGLLGALGAAGWGVTKLVGQ